MSESQPADDEYFEGAFDGQSQIAPPEEQGGQRNKPVAREIVEVHMQRDPWVDINRLQKVLENLKGKAGELMNKITDRKVEE